jgi:hypothetical protein
VCQREHSWAADFLCRQVLHKLLPLPLLIALNLFDVHGIVVTIDEGIRCGREQDS